MVRAMAVGMLVAGCVTPYQPQGFTGGYSDSRVAPGVFVVRIRGNGYTRSDTLVNYAVRRGRELCRGDGFPHAILADEADSANYSRTAGNYSSTTSVYGNTAYTQGSYSPGYVIEKHTITARAVCLTESEWERRSATMRSTAVAQQGVTPDPPSEPDQTEPSGTAAAVTRSPAPPIRYRVFGGADHSVYLGCLCATADPDSLANKDGPHGSRTSDVSVTNHASPYGAADSNLSVCNRVAGNPPVIVDDSNAVVGRLTLNPDIARASTDPRTIGWLEGMCAN